MKLALFLQELRELSKPGASFKPHKYLLLLAVLHLIKKGKIQNNRIYYNEALKEEFRCLLTDYGSDEDRDRPYNPFFHLRSASFWKLVPTSGHEAELKNAQTVTGPGMLLELVQYAELSKAFFSKLQEKKSYSDIESLLLECIAAGRKAINGAESKEKTSHSNALRHLFFTQDQVIKKNPFLAYLNSLHRLNASNENALAEYQACEPLFSKIHVPHPLTQTILDELRDIKGRQVVLTGHAGDGKSTIALEVYKKLSRIPADQPLPQPLKAREDISGTNISIFKDLSERRKENDAEMMQELLGEKRRFLIVSNTGALLDFFRNQSAVLGVSSVQLESDVLGAIGNYQGKMELTLGRVTFLIINLARIDNLDLARKIFERMVDPAQWSVCEQLSCRANCPICLNVDLINHNRKIVVERLFLAYRRMYEYGTRLTLRQLTEHLAYLITSGLQESDLSEMRKKRITPLKTEFMFFNRFFGDNGKEQHSSALQMQAVREVLRQGFGERPCPIWERKLWLKLRDRNFQLGVEDCDKEFGLLRDHGSNPGNNSKPGLNPDQAREQVRRMLYFLYDFKDDQSYLRQFLNSLTILKWVGWQKSGAQLEMTDKNMFEQRIYHVLQEHFTGVRLPEGSKGHDRRLYITLNRGKSEIRQTAQVVIAQIDWSNETTLQLISQQNTAGGTRTDLELQGRGRINNTKLLLTLPFLDYVLMRHFGEVGETLQAAYIERLNRFKAQVQELAKETSPHVMLVRLKTDHTFRRQQYTVRGGKLEVNDVL